jgi:hypothetical protein
MRIAVLRDCNADLTPPIAPVIALDGASAGLRAFNGPTPPGVTVFISFRQEAVRQ